MRSNRDTCLPWRKQFRSTMHTQQHIPVRGRIHRHFRLDCQSRRCGPGWDHSRHRWWDRIRYRSFPSQRDLRHRSLYRCQRNHYQCHRGWHSRRPFPILVPWHWWLRGHRPRGWNWIQSNGGNFRSRGRCRRYCCPRGIQLRPRKMCWPVESNRRSMLVVLLLSYSFHFSSSCPAWVPCLLWPVNGTMQCNRRMRMWVNI